MSMKRQADGGFTLIELLVVMIVLGVLAAVAVPAYTLQRRKAYETSAKADVKTIVDELLAYYVDGPQALTVSGSDGRWHLTGADGREVAHGRLSRFNRVSAASHVNSGEDYCVSVVNSEVDAEFWASNGVGLQVGDC